MNDHIDDTVINTIIYQLLQVLYNFRYQSYHHHCRYNFVIHISIHSNSPKSTVTLLKQMFDFWCYMTCIWLDPELSDTCFAYQHCCTIHHSTLYRWDWMGENKILSCMPLSIWEYTTAYKCILKNYFPATPEMYYSPSTNLFQFKANLTSGWYEVSGRDLKNWSIHFFIIVYGFHPIIICIIYFWW